MVRSLLTLWGFFMEKISLVVEEIFFTKINERWKTSTHQNEHDIENISSNTLTYFPISYTCCYQTELKV